MSEQPSVTTQHDEADGETEVVDPPAGTDQTPIEGSVAAGDAWVDETAREAAPPVADDPAGPY